MTVQDLIDKLSKVEDKNLPVVYITNDGFIDVDAVNKCEWADVMVICSFFHK